MGTLVDGKYFIALMAALCFIVLVLVYFVWLGEGDRKKDLLYLTRQVVPNLLASLLIVVVIYWFIERNVDENNNRTQMLLALKEGRLDSKLKEISPADLKVLESQLEQSRKEQKAKIDEAFAQYKDPSNDASIKRELEAKLRDLFLKSNSIDEKVSEIRDRLALADKINAKDGEIQRLNETNRNLENKIVELKAAVKQISESADKISK